MPTPLPRIQVCAEPALYAAIKTIAKGRGTSISHTAARILEKALDTDKELQEEYKEAAEKYGAVPAPEDKRVRPKAQPHTKVYEATDKPTSVTEEQLIAAGVSKSTRDKMKGLPDIQDKEEKKRILKEVIMELLD